METIEFENFNIQIDSNGYFNATAFYKQFNVVFKDWRNRVKTKHIEAEVQKLITTDLYIIRKGGGERGLYCHPLLIKYVVEWKKPELYEIIRKRLEGTSESTSESIGETTDEKNISNPISETTSESTSEVLDTAVNSQAEKSTYHLTANARVTSKSPIELSDSDSPMDIEKKVFQFLNPQFPSLVNVSTIPESCDFHDQSLDIRFEIKSGKNITTSDDEKFIRDLNVTNAKLGVMISVNCPIVFKFMLNPTRVYIHLNDMTEINVEFLKSSLNTSEVRGQMYRQRRESMSLEKTVEILSDEDSILEVIDKFIEANKLKFSTGYESSHIMADYNTFCARNKYMTIPKGAKNNFFSSLLRKRCMAVVTDKANRRSTYLLLTSDEAAKVNDKFREFKEKFPKGVYQDYSTFANTTPDTYYLMRTSFQELP